MKLIPHMIDPLAPILGSDLLNQFIDRPIAQRLSMLTPSQRQLLADSYSSIPRHGIASYLWALLNDPPDLRLARQLSDLFAMFRALADMGEMPFASGKVPLVDPDAAWREHVFDPSFLPECLRPFQNLIRAADPYSEEDIREFISGLSSNQRIQLSKAARVARKNSRAIDTWLRQYALTPEGSAVTSLRIAIEEYSPESETIFRTESFADVGKLIESLAPVVWEWRMDDWRKVAEMLLFEPLPGGPGLACFDMPNGDQLSVFGDDRIREICLCLVLFEGSSPREVNSAEQVFHEAFLLSVQRIAAAFARTRLQVQRRDIASDQVQWVLPKAIYSLQVNREPTAHRLTLALKIVPR